MSTRITRVVPPTPYAVAENHLPMDEEHRDQEIGLFDDPLPIAPTTEFGSSNQNWHPAQPGFQMAREFHKRNLYAAPHQRLASHLSNQHTDSSDFVKRESPSVSSVASEDSSHHLPSSTQNVIPQRRSETVVEKFGMITPPDGCQDDSPMCDSVDQKGKKFAKSHDKSENARKAANKRHAKEKSRKLSLAATQGAESVAEELESEERKEQYREKNKIAAAKCRNKKRKYNDKIDLQASELESRNKALKTELMDLRNVVLMLKDQILKHSPQDCNCTRLHEYSMAQAARMLQNSHSYRVSSMPMGQQSSVMQQSGSRTISTMSGVSQSTMQTPIDDRRMYGSLSDEMAAINVAGDMAMAVSSSDLARKPSYVQPFHSFQPQYATNDDMHSANGSTMSPMDWSEFDGANEFAMTGPTGEMYTNNNLQFGEQWEYFQ